MLLKPSKASILAALSTALDLVEGQPEGHALRTAQISLKIGEALNLSVIEREDLYFAALLKDSGCSNNASRIHKIFGGDEHLSKYAVKFIDWTSSAESIKFAWHHTEAGRTLAAKLRRLAGNVGPPGKVMNEVTEARCTRGAEIAKMLSFRDPVAGAITYLDEHWDGRGAPFGLAGNDIPLLARILCLAQTYEVFLAAYGPDEADRVITARSGKWFDPEIVNAAEALSADEVFIANIGDEGFIAKQLPGQSEAAIDSDIDAICRAFAMIIDAKSSFTSEHSTRVMRYSVEVGEQLGLDLFRLTNLRRGALLHDIGKLGVPNGILEKPGKLDGAEFDRIKLHPKFGYYILRRIPGFEPLAEIASSHHERLDGKGYWQGKAADDLSFDVRIVSVCDVFDALSAKRPYRDAMPLEKVWEIMRRDLGTSFDPDCFEALVTLHDDPRRLASAA